jgi:hypothetical protein
MTRLLDAEARPRWHVARQHRDGDQQYRDGGVGDRIVRREADEHRPDEPAGVVGRGDAGHNAETHERQRFAERGRAGERVSSP